MANRKVWIIGDTHFNHPSLVSRDFRPADHMEQTINNWKKMVADEDMVIHLGDVIMQRQSDLPSILIGLPGKKILVTGNHDGKPDWYMKKGFAFACYGFEYNRCYFTHRPSQFLPAGCYWNIHGHLHDDDHRNTDDLVFSRWNLLFSLEKENYRPVLLDHFVDNV